MQHTWVREVLADLKTYAEDNDLPDDLQEALSVAAERAKGKLPVVYTDFVPLRKATP